MNTVLRRGRQPKERKIIEIGELRRSDLEQLKARRDTPIVQQFRDPHHRLARCLASGMRVEEAAELCHYSISRVYMFSADPAFKNLVAHYREIITEEFKAAQQDFAELASANMMKAERMISEKLDKADAEGELLPTRDLLAISRDGADRLGFGKKNTNLNVNLDFAAHLEDAIKRSGKVIDITPNPVGRHSPPTNRPVAPRTLVPPPAQAPGVVTVAPLTPLTPAPSAEPALLRRRA